MTDTSGQVIAEFRLDHPVLRETLTSLPEMRVTWQRSDPIDGGRIRVLLWVEGVALDALEAAIETDPTVTPTGRTIAVGDRYLCHLDLAGEGRETSTYPLLVEQGGVIQELTATHEGWEFRVGFPTREEFSTFHEFCAQRDIGFTLHALYVQHDRPDGPAHVLTESQRELLLAALDAGYFEIPRAASLAEVGSEVGISGNAASERIRRGMRNLLSHTLASS